MVIESTSNPLVKQWRKLKDKKYRKQNGEFTVEGVNLCDECMKYRPDLIKTAIVTPDKTTLVKNISDVHVVSEKVMEYIGDTETPQGIILIAKTEQSVPDVKDMKRVLYLDCVKDPGNVGTLIRSADAFGADMVVLSVGCADLYNPKTVRATMGSMFHLPVVTEEKYLKWIHLLKKEKFDIITGSLDAEMTPADFAFHNHKSVICLGNEARGVSEELISVGVTKVKIPMPGNAESLNVAIAGSVLLYEAIRRDFE